MRKGVYILEEQSQKRLASGLFLTNLCSPAAFSSVGRLATATWLVWDLEESSLSMKVDRLYGNICQASGLCHCPAFTALPGKQLPEDKAFVVPVPGAVLCAEHRGKCECSIDIH